MGALVSAKHTLLGWLGLGCPPLGGSMLSSRPPPVAWTQRQHGGGVGDPSAAPGAPACAHSPCPRLPWAWVKVAQMVVPACPPGPAWASVNGPKSYPVLRDDGAALLRVSGLGRHLGLWWWVCLVLTFCLHHSPPRRLTSTKQLLKRPSGLLRLPN